jgi:Fe-S-cluster containining protein
MSSEARHRLRLLDEEIDARVRALREAHPHWPCASGCDACCRALPTLPLVGPSEAARLVEAFAALAPAVREDVVERIRAAPAAGPLTCPFLDLGRGVCRVYDARPVPCRTYGFYADREAVQGCGAVLESVLRNGDEARVVWGNAEAIERALDGDGPRISIRALFA